MSKAQYAILRFAKYKGPTISRIEAHNERTKEFYASNPDIKTELSKYNFHLVKPNGKYRTEAEQQIQKAGCKARKDSVRMVETLITASPEFFVGKKPKEVREFFEHALEFLKTKQGAETIVSAVVHVDEKTPHMHLCFVPITADGRLSAKDIVGNKKKLTQWQDEYWKHMQNYSNLAECTDLSLFRIFNGVNHPVNLYHLDFQHMTSVSRKGDVYALKDKDYKPYYVIPMMQQLSLDFSVIPGLQTRDVCFEYPKMKTPRPLPETIRNYDVIIVSQMYAEDALIRGDYDLLDRLYTIGPAVQDERSIVGTISLRKVVFPLGGGDYRIDRNYNPTAGYLNSYELGRKPSLPAVLQWLNYCTSNSPNAVLDFSYRKLYEYAVYDIRHRQEEIKGFHIYNV